MTIVDHPLASGTTHLAPTPVGFPATSAPEPSSPVELLRLAQAHGQLARRWHDQLVEAPSERVYELVEWNDSREVWVIHWPAGGHLELHDHGGSSGAFWVVAGTLDETSSAGGGSLRSHQVAEGGGAAFGPSYVHDVWNNGRTLATSVHAYSPPLAAMTFYEQSGGALVPHRVEHRTDPTWAP